MCLSNLTELDTGSTNGASMKWDYLFVQTMENAACLKKGIIFEKNKSLN